MRAIRTPDAPDPVAPYLQALSSAARLVDRRWKIVVAFACVYLIWGSTYLAIRYAVEPRRASRLPCAA